MAEHKEQKESDSEFSIEKDSVQSFEEEDFISEPNKNLNQTSINNSQNRNNILNMSQILDKIEKHSETINNNITTLNNSITSLANNLNTACNNIQFLIRNLPLNCLYNNNPNILPINFSNSPVNNNNLSFNPFNNLLNNLNPNALKNNIVQGNKNDNFDINNKEMHSKEKRKKKITKKNKSQSLKKENQSAINEERKQKEHDDKTEFKNSIKYLYIKKNDKHFRFSLSKFYEKTNTGYYNCYDTQCHARGKMQFDLDNINNYDFFNDKFEDKDSFILTKKHTISYEEHSYKRNEIIKQDFEKKEINEDKLKSLKYLKGFLKEFCIRNRYLNFDLLYNKLLEEFPIIKLLLTKEEKNYFIDKYKRKYNINDIIDDSKIEDIINIKILLQRTLANLTKYNYSKTNIKQLILDMKDITGYNLTTRLTVEFIRKNKKYKKDIFILMNSKMKKNLILKDNIQFFADTTYDCVPPHNCKMKLFILLAYNKNLNKILLCMMALIFNENKETLESIFKFLKLNYEFDPQLITVDFGKAGYNAISNIFPKARIFPCYFHLIRRLIIHLKNLRSKNKVLQRAAKNILFNMKILLFIDNSEIDSFFSLIKNKYYNSNKKFFHYFEKNYMKNKPYNDRNWNYYNYLKDNMDSNSYFFTNNACESINRTINSFYKYSQKTFMNFELCIKRIIDLYDSHVDYVEKTISITRILSWYCKCHIITSLKNYNDIEEMTKEYNDHFNYDNSLDELNDIDSSNYNIDNNSSFSSSNISPNYYSRSSEESSEENIIINNKKKINADNNSDEGDNENNNDKKIKSDYNCQRIKKKGQ